jgi:hypothetical protein
MGAAIGLASQGRRCRVEVARWQEGPCSTFYNGGFLLGTLLPTCYRAALKRLAGFIIGTSNKVDSTDPSCPAQRYSGSAKKVGRP